MNGMPLTAPSEATATRVPSVLPEMDALRPRSTLPAPAIGWSSRFVEVEGDQDPRSSRFRSSRAGNGFVYTHFDRDARLLARGTSEISPWAARASRAGTRAHRRPMISWTAEEIDALESLLSHFVLVDDRNAFETLAARVYDRAAPWLNRYFSHHGIDRADADDLTQVVLTVFCATDTLRGVAVAKGLATPAGTAWGELLGWSRRGRVAADERFGFWLGYLAKAARREFRREAHRHAKSREARVAALEGALRRALAEGPESDFSEAAEVAGLGQGIPDLVRLEAEQREHEEAERDASRALEELDVLRRICVQLDELLRRHLDERTYATLRLAYVDGLDSREIAERLWSDGSTTAAARVRQVLSRGYRNAALDTARRAWAEGLPLEARRILERMERAGDPAKPTGPFQAGLATWGRAARLLPD